VQRYSGVEDPHTRERFAVLACASCGLGHTSPVPEDLSPYYGGGYYGGRHGLTHALCLWRRVRLLDRFGGRGAVLDVGCGDGSFLAAARGRGWQVAGTEMSSAAARENGIEVHGSIAEAKGPFDCATLWQSLELLTRAGFDPHWWWHQEIEYDLLGWTQSALNTSSWTHDILLRSLSGRHRSAPELVAGLLLGGVLGAVAAPVAVATALAGSGGTLIVAARRRQ
jgi:SAM-dependent methyltransferase